MSLDNSVIEYQELIRNRIVVTFISRIAREQIISICTVREKGTWTSVSLNPTLWRKREYWWTNYLSEHRYRWWLLVHFKILTACYLTPKTKYLPRLDYFVQFRRHYFLSRTGSRGILHTQFRKYFFKTLMLNQILPTLWQRLEWWRANLQL